MRRTARTAADGVGARGWLEMGGEKKPLVMSDLGCADGCGRQMGAENCVDGCGRRGCNGVAGNGWGEEAAGDERPWLRGRLRTANGCGRKSGKGRERKGNGRERKGKPRDCWERMADGVGARGWLEMGGEKKPLVMSDLVRRTARTAAEGVANGCGELRGWLLRTAWVQRSGGKWVGRRERKGKDGKGRDRKGKEGTGWERKEKGRERKGKEGKGRERKGKEGKGRERMGKEGKGRERMGKERKRMGKEGKGMERTAADGLGAREWLEMGGEKKPLVMSDLGCADGCGRQMGAENCADGCGRRGCKGVAGNGWREEAAGDERPWLRGRLRTANGCGELRGRLRTAWVQRSGWKWVGRRSRW